MTAVKSPPGSLRAERAAVTRRRITDAARVLFASRGYGATTLREIARAAGVAVQTVYAVYGSKASILRALRESLVGEPGADAAFQAAIAAPGGPEALALFARSMRLRWESGHDIVVIHREAASTDPAIREEVDRVLARRRAGIAELARVLARGDGARLDPAIVTAVIDALTMPEVYGELIGAHGWSPDAYEAWLAMALGRLILEPDPPGGADGTARTT